MSTVSQKKIYTPEEYLALENVSPSKSEYYRGEIFAMTGGTMSHNQICGNIFATLHNQLKGKNCQPFNSDQKIKIVKVGLYTYPDVSVICGKPELDERDPLSIVNPRILVEVLSESTEKYDRGRKFDFYRQLESLAEYVLVAQDEPHIERYVRMPDGSWNLTEAKGLDSSLNIAAIECRLLLAEVYDRVTFEPLKMPPNG